MWCKRGKVNPSGNTAGNKRYGRNQAIFDSKHKSTQVHISVSAYYQFIFISEYHKLQLGYFKNILLHAFNKSSRKQVSSLPALNYEVLPEEPINIFKCNGTGENRNLPDVSLMASYPYAHVDVTLLLTLKHRQIETQGSP